jgi:hypothetical protein
MTCGSGFGGVLRRGWARSLAGDDERSADELAARRRRVAAVESEVEPEGRSRSDDGEDVLAELEAELPGFVPGTFGEVRGVGCDPDDYERHSWSRRFRNARHGRPVRTDRRLWIALKRLAIQPFCAARRPAARVVRS